MAKKQKKKRHLIVYLYLMIIITKIYRLIGSVIGGVDKGSKTGHIVFLITRPQDVELLIGLHDTFKKTNKMRVSVWVDERYVKKFPDSLRVLIEQGADPKQIINYAQLLKLPKILVKTDCFFNTTECTINQHKLPFVLTRMANAAGVSTYTLQHGFENTGLTYKSERDRQAVKFAAKTVLTWGPVEHLPVWVEKETLNKCVAVGCPKALGVVANDSQLTRDERPIIGIFDNLHWHRYDEKYVSTFLDHMEEVASRRKNFRFILKSHPVTIRRRSMEPDSRLNNVREVDIADLLDIKGQKLTTPWLLSNALGVITTPSTIALDSALCGVPVAVTRYGLDLDYYAPLSLIDDLDDWWRFLDRLTDEHQYHHLKLNGKRFVSKVLVPGDSAVKISDLVVRQLRNRNNY